MDLGYFFMTQFSGSTVRGLQGPPDGSWCSVARHRLWVEWPVSRTAHGMYGGLTFSLELGTRRKELS